MSALASDVAAWQGERRHPAPGGAPLHFGCRRPPKIPNPDDPGGPLSGQVFVLPWPDDPNPLSVYWPLDWPAILAREIAKDGEYSYMYDETGSLRASRGKASFAGPVRIVRRATTDTVQRDYWIELPIEAIAQALRRGEGDTLKLHGAAGDMVFEATYPGAEVLADAIGRMAERCRTPG